jgi:hypothetical protein
MGEADGGAGLVLEAVKRPAIVTDKRRHRLDGDEHAIGWGG